MKREAYFKKVYEIVAHIPPGRVATYGQLAHLAGFGHAPRMAGQALFFAPENLPCHRSRLEAEGVCFRPNGCVDLKKHLWDPYRD